MLRLAPYLTIGILIGPIITGLAFIIGPAFGFSILESQRQFSVAPFIAAVQEPGFLTSVWLSFWIGPATALISLIAVILFTASFSGSRFFMVATTVMKPVIAMPHAAAAFGLAFLIAPSGFILRLISPELTGFARPPDWLVINDPGGWALLLGLVIKEIPFLFLVTIAALPQVDDRRVRVAQTFGYGRVWAWLTSVFPAVYAQVRLPVYAVIAFATSVVDVALILGPGTPPPLSVRILRWMGDPDLMQRSTAAAAALIQLGVTVLALSTWWLGERFIAGYGCMLAMRGHRWQRDFLARGTGVVLTFASIFAVLGGIALMALWSVSGLWRFPDALPKTFTLMTWIRQADQLWEVSLRAVIIGASASFIALVLVLACLENEYRRQIKPPPWTQFALYLPLLVPQIAFLFGLSVWLLWYGLDGHLWSVIFAHLVFVIPYVYLLLVDPWNAFDARFLAVGRSLGKSPNRVMATIRLPMLLQPILTAFALGFAISIAQYLPTLLIGAGRQPTVTTEAVALASGGSRRLIGSYALIQTLLPFVVYALTALFLSIMWRNRRALRPGFRR